jgi:hypothetical protein
MTGAEVDRVDIPRRQATSMSNSAQPLEASRCTSAIA